MATNTYYFTGKIEWAKVYQNNLDSYEDGPPFASVQMYLDEDNLEKFETTGSKLKLKANENGSYVKFKRGPNLKFGNLWPEVIDSEGEPFTDLIGNGSIATIKVVVYDSRYGKGTRLEKVRVDEHIVYERDDEQDGDSVDTENPVGVAF